MSLVADGPAAPPRVEEVVPGVWRLRLPLFWEEIRSANAWVIGDRDGCVLVDCGMAGPGKLDTLALGLEAAGFSLPAVDLLVVTHCHGDHYGLAEQVVEAAGCELWMHPDHGHLTAEKRDLAELARKRVERGRRAGVPDALLERCADVTEEGEGVAGIVEPDRLLVEGVVVETGAGAWQAIETPGHAPSHVCLFQPERGLLLSGDHVLPVWAPYFDHGYGEDPVGRYLAALEAVERLEPETLLPGHGQASAAARELVRASRRGVIGDLERILAELAHGPATCWALLTRTLELRSDLERAWAVPTMLAYLEHLERQGAVVTEGPQEEVMLWRAAS